MKRYSLTGMADDLVLRRLKTLAAADLATTAELIAHLGEVDERRLYLPAACPSMAAYCVRELRMSEDEALKRIRVARVARQYPRVYEAIADGRLNVTSVLLLASHLTPANANELLAGAELKSKREIEQLIASWFPRLDTPTSLTPASPPASTSLAPERVNEAPAADEVTLSLAPERVTKRRERLTPLSPGRYEFQTTLDEDMKRDLDYLRELMGHAVPSGDTGEVLKRALRLAVEQLERRKFAKAVRSGPKRGSQNPRYVPAEVRRAVCRRDGGRCAFVSAAGQRCASRTRLEFDHIQPVARGGKPTASNLRLCCRAHNQYLAEQALGERFMKTKRERAKARAAEQAGARAATEAAAAVAASAAEAAQLEVLPWLRELGFTAAEARRGIASCAGMADEPLEHRIRAALRSLAPPSARTIAPHASAAP